MRLTANFSKEEFECPCCQVSKMDKDFMGKLQVLRYVLERPMYINSGYRCERHNREVNGIPTSRHLIGIGADISTVGWTSADLYKVIKEAQNLGFSGIGISKSFIHLDTRTTSKKMWVY